MREPRGLNHGSDADAIARSLSVPDAFAVLFDRHFDAVHRYLARRVGRERADDLASQTFIVAFERRQSFRPEVVEARPWLLGIATGLLLNERRAERRLLQMIARLGSGTDLRMSHTDREPSEIDRGLAAALSGLDDDQRDVLLLLAWGELSYDEIAAALSIQIGTVRSRLSRARAQLRAELDLPPVDSPALPTPGPGGSDDGRA
jgi:RNA polymerase sigma factor (sigma-70 family)